MKIMRTGAKANHGTKWVQLKNPKLRWNPTAEAFDVTFGAAATDFATEARHNYTLRFAPDELASVISKLAEAGLAMDSEEFAENFGPSATSLFRLQVMASGIKLAS